MKKFREFSREMNKIFFKAVQTGDLKTVLILLEARINPNIKNDFGFIAIQFSIIRNDLAMVYLLLNYGAEPTIVW